jgi:hydrogenase maturation protein HypF
LLSGDITPSALASVERMIVRRFNAPLTTSAGRLFDAVAALVGVQPRVSYEGQAAIELEWLASGIAPEGIYSFEMQKTPEGDPPAETLVVDLRPMIVEVARDVRRRVAPPLIGRRFHSTMVEVIARVCGRLRAKSGLDAVVLSGGVFLNALLTAEAAARLASDGFRVYRHRRVPPNDGGLSLGQLAVAAAWATIEGVADVPGNPGESR